VAGGWPGFRSSLPLWLVTGGSPRGGGELIRRYEHVLREITHRVSQSQENPVDSAGRPNGAEELEAGTEGKRDGEVSP
jgi:hypothetical protein